MPRSGYRARLTASVRRLKRPWELPRQGSTPKTQGMIKTRGTAKTKSIFKTKDIPRQKAFSDTGHSQTPTPPTEQAATEVGVAHAGLTTRAMLEATRRILADVHAPLTGLVVNGASKSAGGYAASYYAAYGRAAKSQA